jgi:hypothetical protein
MHRTWVSFLSAPLSRAGGSGQDDSVLVEFTGGGLPHAVLLATDGPLANAYLVATATAPAVDKRRVILRVTESVPERMTLLVVADTDITAVTDTAANGWSAAVLGPGLENAWRS